MSPELMKWCLQIPCLSSARVSIMGILQLRFSMKPSLIPSLFMKSSQKESFQEPKEISSEIMASALRRDNAGKSKVKQSRTSAGSFLSATSILSLTTLNRIQWNLIPPVGT